MDKIELYGENSLLNLELNYSNEPEVLELIKHIRILEQEYKNRVETKQAMVKELLEIVATAADDLGLKLEAYEMDASA